MVRVMEKLGPKVAIPIATCIGHMETVDHRLTEAEGQADTESDFDRASSPDADGAGQASGFQRDPELEHEEKLIRAHAAIRQLQEQNTSLKAELERKREEARSLDEDLTSAKRRLERGGFTGDEDETLADLRRKLDQDKDDILNLETQLERATETNSSLERQLERLKEDSEDKQALRDQMQLIRVERDDLLQKSKAAENLKKKIQSLQESDKTNTMLREDLEAAQAEVRSMQKFKERCGKLQAEIDERKKALDTIEQDMYEQTNKRKRLEREFGILSQQYDAAKTQRIHDQETIQEQEAKIKNLESGQDGRFSLDTETVDEDRKSNPAIEKSLREATARNAELEEEIFQLREGINGNEEASIVNKNLQMMRERYEKLEKKYLDTYQENLGLDASLKEVGEDTIEYLSRLPDARSNTDQCSSRPFLELRERLRVETDKSAETESRAMDLETRLSAATVQLAEANAKLAAVDKDQSVALDSLKESVSSNTATLQSENERLSARAKNLEHELFEAKSLLRHALLDPPSLAKEDPSVRSGNEAKLISEQLKLLSAGQLSADDIASRLAHRIEDARVGEAGAMAAQAEVRSSFTPPSSSRPSVELLYESRDKTPLPSASTELLAVPSTAFVSSSRENQRRSRSPDSPSSAWVHLAGNGQGTLSTQMSFNGQPQTKKRRSWWTVGALKR